MIVVVRRAPCYIVLHLVQAIVISQVLFSQEEATTKQRSYFAPIQAFQLTSNNEKRISSENSEQVIMQMRSDHFHGDILNLLLHSSQFAIHSFQFAIHSFQFAASKFQTGKCFEICFESTP